MTTLPFAFPAQPQSVLPLTDGSAGVPVNRIFCVGRNYAAHAVEMGHDPDREPPFFFLKPREAVLTEGRMPYPPATEDLHHEVELVAILGEGGRDIPVTTALDHVFGYAIGLDMTRRDRQGEAKKAGRPWEVGKAFEASMPCGPVHPASAIGHPERGAITLDVDGERRQAGDLDQMIWSLPEVIANLSTLFALKAGDCIMTGTPAGVGPVRRGQTMVAAIDGLGSLEVTVV
ncbi:MAG: fumarylacetoacetate hydrolase family protein [Pseudomonadota bacterium]